jgi:hypothetical protein
MPKEHVRIMRQAFIRTLKDPAFLAEAEKTKLEVDPVTGEDLEKIVGDIFKTNPQVLAKLKDVLK